METKNQISFLFYIRKTDSLEIFLEYNLFNEEFLQENFIFYFKQKKWLLLDIYGAAYLNKKELFKSQIENKDISFLKDFEKKDEFKIYENYVLKKMFVMSDHVFGSLFAVYEQVN